jgi:hypothetical protein
MKKLRSLLELYGSLDKAVSQSDDPEIAAAVDKLLPGASENKGWYREIEHFCFAQHPHGAKKEAKPIEALKTIAAQEELADYEKLRLLYGVAALARVKKLHPSAPLPDLTQGQPRQDLIGALAHLRAEASPEDRRAAAATDVDPFIDHLSSGTGRRAWRSIKEKAVDNSWIAQDVADVPLCNTSVVTVDGYQCVVVDCEFSSNELTLNAVKAIADPRNWDEDYHDFFCNIQPLPARPDGWGRFLETVGFCGEGEDEQDVFKLVTQLKYYKSTPSDTEAHLDYDLDDPTPGAGDGQVKVDRGFINMTSTVKDADAKGVRVRIRKVVHIAGVRPWAQARLVCITGYGTAAREMLLGAADKPPPHPEPWAAPVTAEDTTEQGGTESGKPTSYIATAAVKVWSDCVQDVITRNLDLSEKWMDGRLNFNDLANYSKDISGLLLGAPWEFLQAMNQPRYQGTQSNETPQRGAP